MSEIRESIELNSPPQTHTEVLSRIADVLEPETIRELADELTALADCGVPGVLFEERGGTREYAMGRTSVQVDEASFTISHLLDIDWSLPLSDGRLVCVQASADVSGNSRPRLLVIAYPKSRPGAGGLVCSLKDEEVLTWLSRFADDLATIQKLVEDYWSESGPAIKPPRFLKFVDGIWAERTNEEEQ